MSLLIKNGEIVTAETSFVSDIFCEGETITRIDRHLSAPAGCTVIDATSGRRFRGRYAVVTDVSTGPETPFVDAFWAPEIEEESTARHCR